MGIGTRCIYVTAVVGIVVIIHLDILCINYNYVPIVLFAFGYVSNSVATVKINANPPGANG